MTEVEASEIEKAAGIKTEEPKRKRRKEDPILPEELKKLSGDEVLRVLDFMHRRYLSWMTEAESVKYSSLYKSARDEALKETLETYAELQKQNQALMERMEKLIQALEGRLQPTQIAQETAQQIKKSILDDPRVRTLIAVGLDAFLKDNEVYQKYRPLVICTLLPESCVQENK